MFSRLTDTVDKDTLKVKGIQSQMNMLLLNATELQAKLVQSDGDRIFHELTMKNMQNMPQNNYSFAKV